MREKVTVAALLYLLATVRSASADGPASPEHDAIFRNGLDQYAHGNNVGAVATWETLLGTLGEERGYKVLYNLGLAYQAIGDISRAIERYGAFIKQVGRRDDVPRDLANRASDAQTRLEQLRRSHGAISVHAPLRGGLVLTRIGTSEPRAAGYVVWLASGRHDLELFVGTDHVKRITIDVEQGTTVDVDTSPPEERTPPERATAPQPAHRPESVERSSAWIWIGAGATVASVAVPIVSFVVASNEKDNATALGRGNSGYDDARSRYETWKTVHYVSYALPAALALATVAYVIFRPSAKSSASVGITSSGLSLRGAF